jgi:hypothetical protein
MKKLLTPLCILLGGLFVFSGLVKLNDPVGTAIKLEEYFEVFAQDFTPLFELLIPFALPMSLVFCVAEVVLGIVVLIRHRMALNMWFMLVLILFFTFLTFYSAFFNKVTDCGCFGDFIKLTPWTSFGKDVFLLVIVLILFVYRNGFPQKNTRLGDSVVGLFSILYAVIGIYAIKHLPYLDWRPYKVGAHIPTLMKPSGAYHYQYTMRKNGKEQTFAEYPDSTWEYVDMKVLNPDVAPKITDYRVWTDEADFTDSTFTGSKLFVIVRSDEGYEKADFKDINLLVAGLEKAETGPKVAPWVLTSLDSKRYENFRHKVQLAAPFYYSDGTVLKTIMRTQVGTWLLKDGKVLGKWAFADTPTAEEVQALVTKG